MKEVKKNQVNRCFRECHKKSKKSGEPKALPLTEQQKEEKIKKALLRKKADKALKDIRSEHNNRYSIFQLLRLLEHRYPSLLARAVERVEGQKNRNELTDNEVMEFETFKASLLQKQEK
ncbi:MAG: hypothetical protein AAB529_02885 [Patescibacteria group bacterium]